MKEFGAVVTMGCGDVYPFVPAKKHIDWQVLGPRDMPPDEFREVRNLIVRDFVRVPSAASIVTVSSVTSSCFFDFRVGAPCLASLVVQRQLRHDVKRIPPDHSHCAVRRLPSDVRLHAVPDRCATETTYDQPRITSSNGLLLIDSSRINHRLCMAVTAQNHQ